MHIHRKFLFNFFSRSYALFELRNLPKIKDTTQNSLSSPAETAQQNFVKLRTYEGMHFYRKCWFDLFRSNLYSFWTLAKIILCNSDETGFLSDCPSLMLGIAILKQCWSVGYVSLLTLSFINKCFTIICMIYIFKQLKYITW